MKTFSLHQTAAAVAILGSMLVATSAQAADQFVDYHQLVDSSTVAGALGVGDTLFIDTYTTEQGSLAQSTTFTVGTGVGHVENEDVWLNTINIGPKLTDVTVSLYALASGTPTLVFTAANLGSLGQWDHAYYDGVLTAGSYMLSVTGTALRETSLDVSLSFTGVSPVPETESYGLMLAGLGAIGAVARMRRRKKTGSDRTLALPA